MKTEPAVDCHEAPKDAAGLELLTFRTGGQRYALEILDVREIRSWSVPTPLPHAQPYMRGMVNLRGLVLPVMDLAQRLGLPPTVDAARNVIIVVQADGRLHGLLVEAVADIVQAAEGLLQDVPRTVDDAEASAERLLLLDGEVIQILSLGRILPTLRSSTAGNAA